uniref:FLYWCH-type domain-containing protein n=1 Tax=Timema douglasi TaxID=61478 RepID=A0A7R8VLU6_TIMDO|nr:unnamed protein product [Timema douglasi]
MRGTNGPRPSYGVGPGSGGVQPSKPGGPRGPVGGMAQSQPLANSTAPAQGYRGSWGNPYTSLRYPSPNMGGPVPTTASYTTSYTHHQAVSSDHLTAMITDMEYFVGACSPRGYQYRQHRPNSWGCVKEEEKCRGSVKTTTDISSNKIITLKSAPHTCVPDVAEIEVKKRLEECRKRAKAEVSDPVNEIFRDEMKDLYTQGYEFVTSMPKYNNVKDKLCELGRTALGTEQNPT